MMDQSDANTLRSRAAAALSRHRLEEMMQVAERKRETCRLAQREIRAVLGVPIDVPERLPVEVGGMMFSVEYDDYGGHCLTYEQPCLMPGCNRVYVVKIRTLADLGQAMEDGPALCPDCDG